jgi:hypothetical protein
MVLDLLSFFLFGPKYDVWVLKIVIIMASFGFHTSYDIIIIIIVVDYIWVNDFFGGENFTNLWKLFWQMNIWILQIPGFFFFFQSPAKNIWFLNHQKSPHLRTKWMKRCYNFLYFIFWLLPNLAKYTYVITDLNFYFLIWRIIFLH